MNDIRDEVEVKTNQIVNLIAENKITTFKKLFMSLHAYEQATIFLQLKSQERHLVFDCFTVSELADIFDAMDAQPEQIIAILEEISPKKAATILDNMYTDNVTAILSQLDINELATYLSLMPRDSGIELRELLNYDDQTAGALLTTEYVAIKPGSNVGDALRLVKQEANNAETIYYLYVIDTDEHLIGIVSLRDLLTHPDEANIMTITNERVIAVHPADDQAQAANLMRDYNFMALPVTDLNQQMLGIITIDDIVDVMDEEAVSDYSGLAGVDVEAIAINPLVAAKKRLPWLITLLFLGMSTATLISHYEALVSKASILAVFISLITGTAGNAGTQSLAVAVRRIALNEETSMLKMILKEILIGLIIGIITGIAIMLIVGFWQRNWILGFAIGMAMTCAITVANVAGALIPLAMNKLGVDPAVASGPFISTLSDLTSVLIYFSIAQIFLSNFINHH